jgi:hypothetical protein
LGWDDLAYTERKPMSGETTAELAAVGLLIENKRLTKERDEAREAGRREGLEEARTLADAVRRALGTMQKPMERMAKVCALGLVEPACDHPNLRALQAAMRTLEDAHTVALRALAAAPRPETPPTDKEE